MARPEGRAVIHDLARHADVFVENFMPGVAGRLGCDEKTLRALKPDLVYCSISGFGQTGPWRARPAFAHIINAQSGLMHLEQGDEAAPRASNLQAADVLAGTHAAGAIMARSSAGGGPGGARTWTFPCWRPWSPPTASPMPPCSTAAGARQPAPRHGGGRHRGPESRHAVRGLGRAVAAMLASWGGPSWIAIRDSTPPRSGG
jgi:hypothetical protein